MAVVACKQEEQRLNEGRGVSQRWVAAVVLGVLIAVALAEFHGYYPLYSYHN